MLMQRADEEQLLRISVMKTAGVGRPRWPTAEEAQVVFMCVSALLYLQRVESLEAEINGLMLGCIPEEHLHQSPSPPCTSARTCVCVRVCTYNRKDCEWRKTSLSSLYRSYIFINEGHVEPDVLFRNFRGIFKPQLIQKSQDQKK